MKFENNYEEEFASMKAGRQILKITNAEYDEERDSVSLTLTNKEGAVCYENFYLRTTDGEVSEIAKRKLDFFAFKVLGHKNEYEESDFVGKYINAYVTKNEYKVNNGSKNPFDLDGKDENDKFYFWTIESVSGFGKTGGSGSSSKKKSSDDIDLDDELG